MKYKYIIGIDPSGAYYEGKGTTGYCVYMAADKKFIDLGKIQASGHNCAEAYWHAHINFLNSTIFSARGKRKNKDKHTIVVIEDYFLYANKAESQINSRMETSKLIGVLQHWCWAHNPAFPTFHCQERYQPDTGTAQYPHPPARYSWSPAEPAAERRHRD